MSTKKLALLLSAVILTLTACSGGGEKTTDDKGSKIVFAIPPEGDYLISFLSAAQSYGTIHYTPTGTSSIEHSGQGEIISGKFNTNNINNNSTEEECFEGTVTANATLDDQTTIKTGQTIKFTECISVRLSNQYEFDALYSVYAADGAIVIKDHPVVFGTPSK